MLTEHPTESQTPTSERTSWVSKFLVPEMWGAVAIAMMWLAVLFDGVYGPNIVISNSSGFSSVPSVVVVAFFALLSTVPVARRTFHSGRD